MDQADRSFQEEQSHLSEMIKLATAPSTSRYKPVGYCLACYDDVPDPQLFCNKLCAKEHDQMTRLGNRR